MSKYKAIKAGIKAWKARERKRKRNEIEASDKGKTNYDKTREKILQHTGREEYPKYPEIFKELSQKEYRNISREAKAGNPKAEKVVNAFKNLKDAKLREHKKALGIRHRGETEYKYQRDRWREDPTELTLEEKKQSAKAAKLMFERSQRKTMWERYHKKRIEWRKKKNKERGYTE